MTILTLSDFKIIGLKENFSNFKGPVYFSMLGTQPGGKPPIKIEACAFEEVKKQLDLFKVRNGSRVVAQAKWKTYQKNGKQKDIFEITDVTLMPFTGIAEIPQSSTINVSFVNFSLSGLKNGWEKESQAYLFLKDKSQNISVSACAFGELIKKMQKKNIDNGCYVCATAKWQTYIKNTEVKYSFKITDIEPMPVIEKVTTTAPSSHSEGMECDLNSL